MTPGVTVNQRSINERIQEFRNDPEKMDVTTKFVNEVVEKAKNEALTRMKERDRERSGEGDAELKKGPETSYAVGYKKEAEQSSGQKNSKKVKKQTRKKQNDRLKRKEVVEDGAKL